MAELLEPIAQPLVADDVVAVVALDALEVRRVGSFALAELQPLLERHDARTGIAQVDLAGEAVELLHPLDRVALDEARSDCRTALQQVDEDRPPEEVVDLFLARGVAPHQPLQRGRLVRRVVVDVERRIGREPLAEEVHQPLERTAFRGQRELPVVLARPERVERAVGLEDAEQVVEAVIERVRVALDIEEQVVRRRLRQDRESALWIHGRRRDRAGGARTSAGPRSGPRAGSWPVRGRATRAAALVPSSGGTSGISSRPRASSVVVPRSVKARRWRDEIPATRLRWSSARRRVAHSAAQRQTSQCSTGSGYVSAGGNSAGVSDVIVARKRSRADR